MPDQPNPKPERAPRPRLARLAHWLPRLVLGVFALSLLFPLPRYLAGLEGGEYTVWLSQVSWVGQLALAMLLAGAVGIWWGRRGDKGDRDP